MNICLYGASSPEIDPVYLDAAYAFGRLLAQHGHTLVYGGGAQGVATGFETIRAVTVGNAVDHTGLLHGGNRRCRPGGDGAVVGER